MKRVSGISLAMVAATAVIAGSAATASAAPAHAQAAGYQTAAASLRSGNGVTVPLELSPGTHAIAFAAPAAAATQSGSSYVDIRVGKNNCGGYKGTVSYGPNGLGIPIIQATGTLWDNCNYYTPNTTVYLYIAWAGAKPYTDQSFASVSGTQNTENIGDPGPASGGDLTDLSADTCLKWNNGWGCGPAKIILSHSA